ncbi:AraC family transcriptional regulator [Clostridium sp. MCC353]|uniref:helix-turn-helix domain-containing protein n=1 Tax=Clostridium sp. MCC353 TaxID=2592646 RepID=UPI001C030E4E|nr:AraC family transcriptional regulator [Clostridium sp. MCC353]MBT9776047.1 AraC family transcriptional regulator [Clostridium sp. MCC353]
MYRREKGVLENSEIYFYTPGITAKNTFFYLHCLGHFWCSSEYCVRRQEFDSYLILYIKSGSGAVESDGISRRVEAGDLVFLDCHGPHGYYADPEWEIQWIHLEGKACENYYKLIKSQTLGQVRLTVPYLAERIFDQITSGFSEGRTIRDYLISKYITDLLTLFFQEASEGQKDNEMGRIAESMTSYICSHLDSPLDLDSLARRCSMSRYHFIRVFKKETGYTPHDFIINARIDKAKYYLKSTNMTVKEISAVCGFQNESSFCTCFKKREGMRPLACRETR